jgi:hypothetical protein
MQTTTEDKPFGMYEQYTRIICNNTSFTALQYAESQGIKLWIPAIAGDCTPAEIAQGEIATSSVQQPAGMWRDVIANNTRPECRWYNHWNPELVKAGYPSPLE